MRDSFHEDPLASRTAKATKSPYDAMISKFMQPCHFCDTEETKKGTGTAKSAKGRDAPIPPSISFCIDSLAQHIDGSRGITNIYLSSLPFLPPFFIREGEIVKWPSQSNPPPRIAVSKQLRIPSFWKETALGIFWISPAPKKYLPENFWNDFCVWFRFRYRRPPLSLSLSSFPL